MRALIVAKLKKAIREAQVTPKSDLSWCDTFFNPKYSRASWMAVLSCANQQLNGNYGVVFYSAIIFEQAGVSVSIGILVTLFLNMMGNLPAFFLLKTFGRRTLMLWSMVALSFLLVLMSLCAVFKWPYILIASTAVLLMVCQVGVLPLGW